MGLSDADLRRIERRATLLAVGMELPLVPSQVLKARVEAALRLEARRAAALLARAQQAEADAARLRAALTATMQRTTGYDWNADPDNITLLQSEALHV